MGNVSKKEYSPLQKERSKYQPKLPDLLASLSESCFEIIPGKGPKEALRALFQKTFNSSMYRLKKGKGKKGTLRIGVFFSGGQASGGHNVIAGLFDAGATLIGFLNGPDGLIKNKFIEVKEIDSVRNQGGFDLLGSGRTKIETQEQMAASLKAVLHHRLDGLCVIGGDDSNTNAAHLAEYFLEKGCKTKVVGVPKTIDGDLRSDEIEMTFGFDSATKTYSEIIGNIARDALSSKKYYHFIKLMGRSASHITLECALKTQPNLALISEERRSLAQIVSELADLIILRHSKGKEYGVILIPEGLVEFVPEFQELGEGSEKDPHGNIELSKIKTEELLLDRIKQELERRQFGGKFNALTHFLGYEGRSCMPSNFDADYAYALGKLAYLAVREELTGVICAIQNLREKANHWEMKMVPIVQLMHFELRSGKQKPVIQKFLVDLNSKTFLHFSELRSGWAVEDRYMYPGPIQFFGNSDLTDSRPLSLKGGSYD